MLLQAWTVHEAQASYFVIDGEAKVEENSSDLHGEKEIKFDVPRHDPKGVPFVGVGKDLESDPQTLEPFNQQQRRNESILKGLGIGPPHEIGERKQPQHHQHRADVDDHSQPKKQFRTERSSIVF